MRKVLLSFVAFVAAIVFGGSAIAQTYVSDLKLTTAESSLTFEFTTSVDAQAKILFTESGEVVGEVEVGAVAAGVNTFTLAVDQVPVKGKTLGWSVAIESDAIVDLEDLTSADTTEVYHYYLPQGVAVDNNPASPNYGYTYVAAATDGASDGGSDRADTQKRGVFVYDQDLKELNPETNVGILPANAAPLMTDVSRQAMHRIAVNPVTNHVAFAYNVEGASAVWCMDPANLAGDAVNLIEGLAITKANAICFDEAGVLYVMDNANTSTGGTIVKVVDGALVTVAQNATWGVQDLSLVSDGRGGLWVAQNRWGVDAYAVLSHVNAAGEVDFTVTGDSSDEIKAMFPNDANASYRGQCAYYAENDILAFGGNKVVALFKVTYDETTGVPSIAKIGTTPAIGNNIDGVAFYANGDLAVVSASAERFVKYAYNNGEVVEAPAEQTIYVEEPAEPTVLNPFAYALSSTLSDDAAVLTVNYSLNANATSVEVVVLNGEEVVKTVACTGINKGSYTVEIATEGLPQGAELTWAVNVKGAEVTAPIENPVKYSLYHPSAVDIDNNPENATFGLILTNEGMQKVKGVEGYLSTGYGAGIYAFNPAFEPIANGENPGFNGGIEFTETRADGAGTAYSPRRIRISEDGRIFVTSLNTDGTYLWEVNPENLNEWTPIFQGTMNEDKELTDAEGNFIVGPNNGFDVKGAGENLQLMLYSVNLKGITGAAMGGFKCAEYNLGTATTWATAPSKMWVEGKYAINYTGTQVVYDNEGGIWIASYRGTANESNPGLVHINANGEEDLKLIWSNVRQAGIRFNHDFTKLVVAGNNGTAKKATVYAVSKDANGAPVLTEELVVDMASIGNNINDFAFDYAGNLYSCGNSAEKIISWAMPHAADAVVATPAASKYAFSLGEVVEPVAMVGIVKRAVQLGESTIVLTHEGNVAHLYNVKDGVITEISQEGVVAIDPENKGDYLAISDIAVTEDGKLVANNYVRCQFGTTEPETGYKKGTSYYYIWNDIAGAPSVWFTSQTTARSSHGDVGYTFALKGTSQNAEILVTAVHNNNRAVRMSLHKVIDGVYVDPDIAGGVYNNDYYINFGVHTTSAYYIESAQGTQFQLNASATAGKWYLEGELSEPTEFMVPGVGEAYSASGLLADGTLGKKYNGATILSAEDTEVMVAPYADAAGKLAGVKILDITNGLAAAEELQVLNLDAPVEATAAATAVELPMDEDAMYIYLVADNTIHILKAISEEEPEPEYMDFELPINNSVFDYETMAFTGSNADYAIEVSLVPDMENPIEGVEMGFGLAATSSITREGNPMEILEGSITVVDIETATANAVVGVKYGEDYYRFFITMTQATAETIYVELVGAAVEHVDNVLSFTSTWAYNDVTYPISVRLNGVEELVTREYEAPQVAELQIGGDGDDDLWLDYAVANWAEVVVEGETIMFGATFSSYATGKNYEVVISTSISQNPDPEYIDMELNITNTVFDAETMAFIGSDDVYGIEVSLVPDMTNQIEEMTFGLNLTASAITFSGQDMNIIEGQIAVVDIETPTANAIVAAKFGEEYYRFNITMTQATAEAIYVEIVGAAVDHVDNVLSFTSTWAYNEVEYPVSVRLNGVETLETREYEAPQVAELQIGGDGDDDPWLDWAVANWAEVVVEGETIMFGATFTSFATGKNYEVVITTTIPTEEEGIVGIVKRAVQMGENSIVLTHEADGTAHIYNVQHTVDGDVIAEVSQDGIIAVDPENAGDLLAISDIAVTEDGKLVAVNYMICQSAEDYVDAGYKRGENRFYIWNDINGDPAVWFTSKMYANWFRSKQALTMAVKGTSQNADIMVTGIHATKFWSRFAHYTVIDGVYNEPADAVTDNGHHSWCEGPADGSLDENVIGVAYELNASPAMDSWILDAELTNPIEFVEPAATTEVIATWNTLPVDLGKKYNGVTIHTVDGTTPVMVAPYADAEGKLAGVKVLNLTNGVALATELAVANLEAPVEATAAATAVGSFGNVLTIYLVADNVIYELVASIDGDDPGTSVDNITTTTAPVKMIKNNQLIIIKNGVKYNAQGAVIK